VISSEMPLSANSAVGVIVTNQSSPVTNVAKTKVTLQSSNQGFENCDPPVSSRP
jgi:hypothetical protein